MKKNKKILCVIFAFTIFTGIFWHKGFKSEASSLKEAYNKRNAEKQEMIDKFMQRAKTHPVSEETVKNLEKYEDECDKYAGKYYNDDGELIVCFTDDLNKTEMKDIQREMNEIAEFDGSEIPEIEIVENSYNELLNEKENLKSKIIEEKGQLKKNVIAIGISDIENKVIVYLKEKNKKIIDNILELSENPDIIIFEKSDEYRDMLDNSLLYLGRRMYFNSNATASVGFPVFYYDSQGYSTTGIITAGHANSNDGKFYSSATKNNNTLIGTNVRGTYQNSKYDARLLKVNTLKFNTTRQTYYNAADKFSAKQIVNKDYLTGTGGDLVGKSVGNPIINEYVIKVGGRTGYTIGKTTTVNIDVIEASNGNRELFRVVADNQGLMVGGGDSGGAVYASRMQTGFTLIGIVTSGNEEGVKGYTGMGYSMQCSKASNILNGLNCRYGSSK